MLPCFRIDCCRKLILGEYQALYLPKSLLKNLPKLILIHHINFWKVNRFKVIEMTVIRDQVIGTSCYSAVGKLFVILVLRDKSPEIIFIDIEDIR